MKNRVYFALAVLVSLLASAATFAASGDHFALETGWNIPPLAARPRAYWWWLNGNVTQASITRDLEEMKAKGFGGAVIVDAGGADQDGNGRVPHGPTFFTPEWRELYKHTLREAGRLGLEISLNIQSGWNLGGPIVTADDAAKKLVWTETQVAGPAHINQPLAVPRSRDGYYRDVLVVAWRVRANQAQHQRIENWREKALYQTLQPFSAPDSTPLFQEFSATPDEEDAHAADVLDLSSNLDASGNFTWDAPPGSWQVLRFGCTVGDHAYVSTASDGWQRAPGATHDSYAIDVLDAGAFNRYWNAIVEPLIADAGPLAGKALKYLHTDSWEVEAINWTPTLAAEFRKRRGYNLLPFMPVLAGYIVDSRDASDRFLADFRKTIGDLAIDNHYRLFRDYAHRHGLEIHPESGGPHAVPIDAQRCLGWDDVPMSEFWAWSWTHRVGDENRYFVKQPAAAAHTYGHDIIQAEGFTTIGPHWQEKIWDNLKPSFDKALCEGMNRIVWHAFVCSPEEMGIPGQQYFAGTHMNPNTTWWPKSAPFLNYMGRCQFMLQQGLFAADVCYYYGDHVPNFTQLKRSDPAHILPGYDYDVITEEALLERASVRDGRLTLPDGLNYRVLVLPDRPIISLPVLRKLKTLVSDGATVIGPKPAQAAQLQDFPACDAEVAALAAEIWGDCDGQSVKEHDFGKGRVFWGRNARDVLSSDNIRPDFEITGARPDSSFDYIHRIADGADVYFVASRSNHWEKVLCTFRAAGKAPEIWDPVSGERRFAPAYSEKDGRVSLPLEFTPCGSCFVVFREPAARHPAVASDNSLKFDPRQQFSGAWTVKFDPKWGGPASVQFPDLVSWTTRDEPGIKYYSGTATYLKTFNLSPGASRPGQRLWLDLGNLRELASVKLNGRDLGIVWTPPFRVDITDAVKATGNSLEVEVVNFWPNRIIGDQFLPADQRFTKTNIRKLTRTTALADSGLFGPVQILQQQ